MTIKLVLVLLLILAISRRADQIIVYQPALAHEVWRKNVAHCYDEAGVSLGKDIAEQQSVKCTVERVERKEKTMQKTNFIANEASK